MRKFRFSFVISSSKDIHQIIPPSFHKLLLIEMTCKKWCPCFTLHLYFFLFTILASIQIVFLFYCRSFLLAWWLFSYQQYSFTWTTRPTSGHCFHHHTSLSIVWHSVCKSIYIYIYIYIGISDLLPENHDIRMSRFNQISSHRGDWLSNGWIVW